MEHYLQGVGISSNYDEFSDCAVESFGGLIGTLLDLF